MALQLVQVVEGIGVAELACVDETHEEIADVRPVQGLVEERTFPVENGLFQSHFAKVVIDRGAGDMEEPGELFPVGSHVGNCLTQAGVGLHLVLRQLFTKPFLKHIHQRIAFGLMKTLPLLGNHLLPLCQRLVFVDLGHHV